MGLSATVPLTTSWQQASELVKAKFLADSLPEPKILTSQELVLVANSDGVFWTRTPTGTNQGDAMDASETQIFRSGNRFSLESLHTLFLKGAAGGETVNITLK